jgi:hypothetical protein
MKALETLTEAVLDELEQKMKLSPEEQSYWDDMEERRGKLCPENDALSRISFYSKELEDSSGRFGDRVAVERRLLYLLGVAYEWRARKDMEGHGPSERAEVYRQAAESYNKADETIGYLSDFCLRQAETCGWVARLRREGGLDDSVSVAYEERYRMLISAYMSSFKGAQFLVTTTPLPSIETATCVETGAATLYTFKKNTSH